MGHVLLASASADAVSEMGPRASSIYASNAPTRERKAKMTTRISMITMPFLDEAVCRVVAGLIPRRDLKLRDGKCKATDGHCGTIK